MKAMDGRIRILLRIIDESKDAPQMAPIQFGSLLGLSEARILRLFKQEVGKTLRQHLLEVKMASAAELLTNGTMPIKAIAAGCLYTHLPNFYRDFKRVYRVSPMQMRILQPTFQLQGQAMKPRNESVVDHSKACQKVAI
jgi:AraC-like DNA-binding protein